MSKDYYIKVNNMRVKVGEAGYLACMRPVWREKKRNIVRSDKERSFDYFEGGVESFPSNEKLVQEIVEDKMLLEMLLAALEMLTEDERDIIDALFHQGKTEREIAADTGISHQAVNRRKERVLTKLRKLLRI